MTQALASDDTAGGSAVCCGTRIAIDAPSGDVRSADNVRSSASGPIEKSNSSTSCWRAMAAIVSAFECITVVSTMSRRWPARMPWSRDVRSFVVETKRTLSPAAAVSAAGSDQPKLPPSKPLSPKPLLTGAAGGGASATAGGGSRRRPRPARAARPAAAGVSSGRDRRLGAPLVRPLLDRLAGRRPAPRRPGPAGRRPGSTGPVSTGIGFDRHGFDRRCVDRRCVDRTASTSSVSTGASSTGAGLGAMTSTLARSRAATATASASG